jgi:ribosomal protein S18 acetylase RimI-like enzyme
MILSSAKGRLASEDQVVDFLRFAVHRRLNLNDIWLAERAARAQQQQLLWAVLPVVSPGRTMLLFSPASPSYETQQLAGRELVGAVCGHWSSRGVHLAQVLLDPSDLPSQDLYGACGFAMLAELIYLQAPGRRGNDYSAETAGLTWRAYVPGNHAQFAQVIAQSYEESLDCPALNGRRDIEDIVAGHKAAGEFEPRLWRLLCHGERPLGVLLLARSRHSDVLELVYLGLTPEARGRGLADVLLAAALHAVREESCACLSLAVDSRNTPALKLYYRHGLSHVCSKLALIRDLRVVQPANPPGNGKPAAYPNRPRM